MKHTFFIIIFLSSIVNARMPDSFHDAKKSCTALSLALKKHSIVAVVLPIRILLTMSLVDIVFGQQAIQSGLTGLRWSM